MPATQEHSFPTPRGLRLQTESGGRDRVRPTPIPDRKRYEDAIF